MDSFSSLLAATAEDTERWLGEEQHTQCYLSSEMQVEVGAGKKNHSLPALSRKECSFS